MVWPQSAWRWGIVVPVTVAALAGGLADIVTGTLAYWYLLAPSYPVIAIAVWRGTSKKAEAAASARKTAALDADEAAASGMPRRHAQAAPTVELGEAEVSEAPLVSRPRRVTVGSMLDVLRAGFVRGLATLVVTFISMVAIWAAIAIGTWGRGYWYIYGPVLAGLAWLAWTVWRSGPADPKGGEKADRPIVR